MLITHDAVDFHPQLLDIWIEGNQSNYHRNSICSLHTFGNIDCEGNNMIQLHVFQPGVYLEPDLKN